MALEREHGLVSRYEFALLPEGHPDLEDSLALQYQQIAQLRAIITGEMDDLGEDVLDPAAFALPDLDAEAVARKAMAIAAEVCVYTNGNLTVETIGGRE